VQNSQCKNIRNIKKHGNTTPPTVSNSTKMDSNKSEVDEIPDKD
jgi:hypothetical protein